MILYKVFICHRNKLFMNKNKNKRIRGTFYICKPRGVSFSRRKNIFVLLARAATGRIIFQRCFVKETDSERNAGRGRRRCQTSANSLLPFACNASFFFLDISVSSISRAGTHTKPIESAVLIRLWDTLLQFLSRRDVLVINRTGVVSEKNERHSKISNFNSIHYVSPPPPPHRGK